MSTTKQRIDWIDCARVIAILLVMQAHTTFCFLFNHDSESGAVATFFLLSGYFSQKREIRFTLLRLKKLIFFYIFWSLYGLIVAQHGFNFSAQTFLSTLIHGSSSGMWFILFLLYCTAAGTIALRMPTILRLLTCLGLFVGGIYLYYTQGCIHPCMLFPIALSIYLLGQLGNIFSPEQWKKRLFPHRPAILRFLPTVILTTILVLSATNIPILPSWILMFVSIWAILGTAITINTNFPAIGHKLAYVGSGVVFIYAVHMPTLRMMTSAYLKLTGELPPYAMSLLFILMVIYGSIWVYTKILGKSKILDACFFAR